jgi:RNA polymerase sigma-70 factor (ECF subfamily)
MDDVALLTRIAAKDEEAFAVFFRRFERPLYGYLFTLVRQQAWVEELISDVMLEVWKGAARFRGTARVSTWLFGIARHKALSLLRHHSPSPQVIATEEEELATIEAPGADPAEVVQERERAERLWEALQGLSVEQREVLQLVLLYDLSYSEIAMLVGCPENTVKTRVFYAKQQLKRILKRFGLSAEET